MKKILLLASLFAITTPVFAYLPDTSSYEKMYNRMYERTLAKTLDEEVSACIAHCVAVNVEDNSSDNEVIYIGMNCHTICTGD